MLCFEKFWKTIKLYLSNKNTIFPQISKKNNNKTILDDFNFFVKFITFFEDDFRSLNIKPDKSYLGNTENICEPITIAIKSLKSI